MDADGPPALLVRGLSFPKTASARPTASALSSPSSSAAGDDNARRNGTPSPPAALSPRGEEPVSDGGAAAASLTTLTRAQQLTDRDDRRRRAASTEVLFAQVVTRSAAWRYARGNGGAALAPLLAQQRRLAALHAAISAERCVRRASRCFAFPSAPGASTVPTTAGAGEELTRAPRARTGMT